MAELAERRHGHGVYLALKAFTRALIEKAGGLEAAATRTRVGKSQLHEYGNPDKRDFIPIDVVADLEADVGEPIVSRALAHTAGFALVREAHHDSIAADPARELRLTTARLGNLADDFDKDLSRRANLTPNSKRQLVKDCEALIAEAQRFIDAVNRDAGR